ncbi:50S ribosomal protein L21 [Bartonella australis AUST/NH1]|uniref:Large ribosomal subunit protein bL21 n=1 Tax=Bartonella australis (strain Aust/NH1) TaxID=1094489 RepID=M1PBZ0_BARAA|nr:50S ribosomal protein L21 [Bartonella australis]AGF74151.1 50S ribosomal protein L21 [Bartonella australis AUST/NH1]
MFAVIKTGGKQYRVIAGQRLRVEKIVGDAGDVVEFSDVLMIGEEESAIIGAPVLADAVVTAEIVEQARARKVVAFKKRRRQNSKRTRGHRQEVTAIRILEISASGLKPRKAAVKSVEKKETVPKKTEAHSSPEKHAGETGKKKAVSSKVKTVTPDESKKD